MWKGRERTQAITAVSKREAVWHFRDICKTKLKIIKIEEL
jgi:hypothetical protein